MPARFRYSSNSVGTSSTAERTVQWTSNPPPECTRAPLSPENASQLRIREFVITEPRIPEPPPKPVLVKEISPDISLMNSLPYRPSSTLEEPQATSPVTDIPRSMPPSEVRQLTSSKIPSSRIGRLFHYGGRSLHQWLSYHVLTFHRFSCLSRVRGGFRNPSQVRIQRRILAKWWLVDVDRTECQAVGDQADKDEGCGS